jgi:superfamily I DNA and RNA helicase
METWWRELRELDAAQRDVIALPPEGSFLVNGPPGSGKTNLLLLRANYLANTQHSNLAIIVFNRTLREFIRAGSHLYNFDPDNVLTSRQFLIGFSKKPTIAMSPRPYSKQIEQIA